MFWLKTLMMMMIDVVLMMITFIRRPRLITIIYTFLPVLLSSFFQSIQNFKNSLPSSPILPLTDISNTLCVLIDDNNFFRLPFQIFKSVIKSTKTKDPPSSSLHNSYNTTHKFFFSLSIQIIKSNQNQGSNLTFEQYLKYLYSKFQY